MKILLIDNEASVRTILKEMIQQVNPSLHIIAEASGVESGLEQITIFQPEVVFLDVEMNDGTGFDLLKRISAPSFQLIFTTAFNQYAMQAFKFSAIDYLMKPVDPVELGNSLSKAARNINQGNLHRQLEVLMQQLPGKGVQEGQIVLKDMDATYFVKIRDIMYCMAEGAYTQFFIRQGDPILVSRNLHSFEELLEPTGFIRCHHSCLVNPVHIKMYDRKTENLVLEGGHSVPVSQRKRDHVIKLLENR
jgi:two-component system LytT family response regulator